MDPQLELAHFRAGIFDMLLRNGVTPRDAIPLTERVYEAFYLGKPQTAAKRKAAKKR